MTSDDRLHELAQEAEGLEEATAIRPGDVELATAYTVAVLTYRNALEDAGLVAPLEPRPGPELDFPYLYRRVCKHCGTEWGGCHCPHDGAQNPCPGCGVRPTPEPEPTDTEDGLCDCKFEL